jgi:preprotein translocase subunit SecF
VNLISHLPLVAHHLPLIKMFNLFQNIHIDWLGKRRPFIAVSILIMLAGLASTLSREFTPGGTEAFNLGVDFKGGTVVTAKFKGEKPNDDAIRAALSNVGVSDAQIQASTDKPDEVLIKIPLIENAEAAPAPNPVPNTEQTQEEATKVQVQTGRETVKKALDTFGKEAEGENTLQAVPDATYKIIGTDSVGAGLGVSRFENADHLR